MENNKPTSKGESRDIRFEEPTFIDPLTGLFNQYYLFQFLPEELKKAKLANYPLAVLMIDLDGFKGVNDKHGHLCGDIVLKQLAAILKNSVRKTDMVIRYAGDEFTILLPTADIKTAQVLAQRFTQDIDKNIFKTKDGENLHLTISVGFAIFPLDAENIDQLIDLADKALYLSKQKGKNRVSHAKEVDLEAISYRVAMDSFPCPKFIDRKEELDRSKHIFDSLVFKSNVLQLVFIEGEVGIGKTRLMHEASGYIQDRAAMISSRASRSHTQDPYYLFAQGISSYIEKIGLDNPQFRILFSQIPGEELTALSMLVEPLANIFQRSAGFKPQESKTRFYLFKAFLDFLIELNKTQGVFIAFDDIQWADRASLELLRYLSKQEKNKRIFMLCTFFQDKSGQGAKEDRKEFAEFLEDLSFNDNFTQLSLKNFSIAETIEMTRAIFPDLEAQAPFYQWLHDITKGNASYIEEVLKSTVENGNIFYQDNRWQIKKELKQQDMPLSIEDVIKRRIKNIDEETKEMIVQAAVIGDDFSSETLKKIGNKDEGFTLELLNRAKKMRLIDELNSKGDFGFTNKNLQNTLYNDLDQGKRKQLHYEIGKAIEEKNKNNVYNVAGEVAFHFNQAPQQYNLSEYSRQLLKKTSEIFLPNEVIEYLDKLAQEVMVQEQESPVSELDQENFQETLRLLMSFQSAVRNFQLYPPGAMRVNVIAEAYAVINKLWQSGVEGINLGEVERGLVINGKRLSPKETHKANIEYFLSFMLEHNLKTISFNKTLTDKELDIFVQYLSRPPKVVKDCGGWAELIKKHAIKGIKVDEVRFIQVGSDKKEFEDKRKLEDVMLMEFLLGKVEDKGLDKKSIIHNMVEEPKKFAKTISEASQQAVKEGRTKDPAQMIVESIEKINNEVSDEASQGPLDYAKKMANVIMELEPSLRNDVIRYQARASGERNKEISENVIKAMPDEVLVEMILEDYNESNGNLIALKSSLDNLLSDGARKNEIVSRLEKELSKSNVSPKDIEFISGQIKWDDLPIDKRIEDLLKMPDSSYETELNKINSLLEELTAENKKEEFEKFFYHLIAKAGKLSSHLRRNLLSLVIDFAKQPFLSANFDLLQTEYRLQGLLKRINIELENQVLMDILEIFKDTFREFTKKLRVSKNITPDSVEKPDIKKFILFIQQFLNVLCARYKWEETRNPNIYKIIGDFIRDISTTDFLELFIYSLVENCGRDKFDLRNIFPLVGERIVNTVIKLENDNLGLFVDSFREYVIRKGIADLLRDMGEIALNMFGEKFAQLKDKVSQPLIEMVGYLRKEEWVDLLVPLLYHNSYSIRRSALIALGDIGKDKAYEIISGVLRDEKDKKMRNLAKEQLNRIKEARS
jgi:diguanylate cyclase (GGDEF)-like protein